jgi:hypothetical protein
MTRIEAFIPVSLLFRLINRVAEGTAARLVFQRFESPKHQAGFTVFEPREDLATEYVNGGYQLIYLSINGIPKNGEDWDFLDRESEYLIEFAGGRQNGQDLEQVVIRPMAKKNKVAKPYKELQSGITEACHQGVNLNGTPYPKIFYAKELVGKKTKMWVDLETKSISALILE